MLRRLVEPLVAALGAARGKGGKTALTASVCRLEFGQ